MKSFFIAAALSLSALSAAHIVAPAAQAQLPQQMMEDIQALGEWSSAFNDFNILFGEVFMSEEFEALSIALNTDDRAEIQQRHAAWKSVVSQQVTDIKNTARNFPRPPVISTPDLKKIGTALTAQYDSLADTADQVSDMVSQIDSVVVKTMAGDDTGLADLSKIVIRSGQRIIRSENVMITTSLQSIPRDHPNYFLISMMMDINSMTDELQNIYLLSWDDKTTLDERSEVMRKMEQHLKSARDNSVKVRKANAKYKKQVSNFLNASSEPQERRVFKSLMTMLESFDESVASEDAVVDIMKAQIDLLNQDVDLIEIEDEMARLDEETYPFLDARLRQQGERTQLLSQMQ